MAKSGAWRSCRGYKYCHKAEGLANQFLESVDAFKTFDEILRPYGLRRKWVHIDDMGVGERAGQVSCNGLIVIAIEKRRLSEN